MDNNIDVNPAIHVLVVDDDKSQLEIIERQMNTIGYNYSFAENAGEALLILEKKHIDVVITDIRMPEMDGMTLIKKIKDKYDAYVVVMTGYSEEYSFDEALDLGADDFIVKSFSPKIFEAKLKRVLRERKLVATLKATQKELLAQEEQFRLMFESSHDLLTVADENGKTLLANKAWQDVLGYTPDNQGDPFDKIHPDDHEKVLEAFMAMEQNKIAFTNIEYRYKCANGQYINLETTARRLNIAGKPRLFVAAHDITKRKQSEQTLKESERKYRQLFNTVSDSILVFEADSKNFIDANKHALALYGYSKEEFLKLNHTDITAEQEAPDASIKSTLAKELSRIPLRFHKKKDGTVFPVEISASTFTLGNRSVHCDVVRDISAQLQYEKALLHASQYTDNIIQNMIDSLLVINIDGTIKSVNSATLELLGYDENELIGNPISKIIREEEEEEEEEEEQKIFQKAGLQEFLKNGYIKEIQRIYLAKDGRNIPVLLSGSVMSDRDEKAQSIICVAKDISDMKQAQATLLHQKKQWEITFNAVPDLIAIMDPQHRIVQANKAMIDKLCIPEKELKGRNCYELIHKVGSPPLTCPHARLLADKKEHTQEIYESHLGGCFLITVSPIFDASDQLVGSVHVARDINDFKEKEEVLKNTKNDLEIRIEERTAELVALNQELKQEMAERLTAMTALQKSEARFKMLVETIPYGIADIDINGTIHFVNSSLHKIYGYGDGELIGKNIFESIVSNEDQKPLREFLKYLTKEKPDPTPYFGKHRKKDGTPIDVQIILNDKKNNQGQIIGFTSIITDISEQRQAEAEAKKRNKQLIEADKMVSLGILVAGIAHEINNPNTLIMMNTPILQKVWDSIAPILSTYYAENGDFQMAAIPYSEMRDQIPKIFQVIENGSERIKLIITSLKDYTQKDIGQMLNPIQVNEVIQATLIILANPIKKATHKFVTHYKDTLPAILANFQRLEQVLINVIMNACQALTAPCQGIYIATDYDEKASEVVVKIKDEGRGISAETLSHIQDPFFTTRREIGGTGLGLSISRGILEEHGGRFEFESTLGKGTTVFIRLPAFNPETQKKAISYEQ